MKPSNRIFLAVICCIMALNCVSQVFAEDIPAADAGTGVNVVSDTSLDTAPLETPDDPSISGEEPTLPIPASRL